MASDDVILESGRLPQVVAGLHWQRASESLDHEMAKKKYKVAIFLSFFLPIYLLDLQLQLLLNYRSMTSIALNSRSLTLGDTFRAFARATEHAIFSLYFLMNS